MAGLNILWLEGINNRKAELLHNGLGEKWKFRLLGNDKLYHCLWGNKTTHTDKSMQDSEDSEGRRLIFSSVFAFGTVSPYFA